MPEPSLLGLVNTNRDFRQSKNWGKNIFNNAFPTALACYMHQKQLSAIYITLNQSNTVDKQSLPISDFFGIDPFNPRVFYAFESDFAPYQPLVIGNLPRTDLVIMDRVTNQSLCGIEIKLTALPDNTTHHLTHDRYGCELVVRPDTITYLALSIAANFKSNPSVIKAYFSTLPTIEDWSDMATVTPSIPSMAAMLTELMLSHLEYQQPLVMQPIWKTEGKLLQIHEDAFDIFIWSNFAFTQLFFRSAQETSRGKPTRGARSIAWLAKMLLDFAEYGRIDYPRIIDLMSFNTKNDKAFATSGTVTHYYMTCAELTRPRVKRHEIQNIVLGGGENFLSPERRLDAAILSTPHLFDED